MQRHTKQLVHDLAAVTGFLVLFGMALATASCGGGGSGDVRETIAEGPPKQDPAADTNAWHWVADTLIWAGGIAVVVGTLGMLAAVFWAPLKPLRSIFIALLGVGTGALVIGPVANWIGDNQALILWLVILIGTIVGLACAWAYEKQWIERMAYRLFRREWDLDGDGRTGRAELDQRDIETEKLTR